MVEDMHIFVNKAMRKEKSLKRVFVSEPIDEMEKRVSHQVGCMYIRLEVESGPTHL